MAKKIVTQEDLDLYPDLVTEGIQVGDEIEIPDETEENEQTSDDDTGGSNPPPGKKRP